MKTESGHEVNDIRFRSSDRLFQNTTCVFIEYTDTIGLQWFTFLSFFRNNDKVTEIFKTDEIRYLTTHALLNYYFNREYRNPLACLLKDESIIEMEKLDKLLNDLVNENEIFFNVDLDSFLVPIIVNLLDNSLIKELRIYYPEENEFVENDIKHKFGDKAKLVTGNLEDAISDTPDDTTYFFSDVMNILVLEELDKLNYSAIMIPDTYRYNYTDDSKEKFLVDLDYLSSKYIFKWGTYKIA